MDKLDQLIKEALSEEKYETLQAADPQGYFSLALGQFRGKLGWVTWVIMSVQVVLFVAGVCCAVQFFASTEILSALKWGLSAATSIILSMNLKLSLMPQMQADRVIREIKRLELLWASQSQK